MPIDFSWNAAYSPSFFAIVYVALGFAAYWFISTGEGIKTRFFPHLNTDKGQIHYAVFQKLTGVFFLGIIPLVVMLSVFNYSFTTLGIQWGNWQVSLKYCAIMGAIIIVMNYFASNKPDRLAFYPQMRLTEWTKKRVLVNSISWIAYLAAYEILFRGVLLFPCYAAFGFWPAAAINVALYAATHIPKGPGETVGAAPYGLLLCYVTLLTQSITVAIVTHVLMALSNDYFSVHHNKNMRFV